MNMRERMLAMVQGVEHDRVPFAQYDGMVAPNEEVWSLIGRENMGVLRWVFPYSFESPNCRFDSEQIERNGLLGTRTTLYTPKGQLVEERFYEPAMGTSSVRKHFVTEPEDYAALIAYFSDMTARENMSELHRALEELGDDGLPHVSVPRTPYQQLWVQWFNGCPLKICAYTW